MTRRSPIINTLRINLTSGIESSRVVWTGAREMAHLSTDETLGIGKLAYIIQGQSITHSIALTIVLSPTLREYAHAHIV